MNFRIRIFFLLIASLISVLPACQDKWDDHTSLKDANLGQNLFQRVQQEPSLSKFSELLLKSKYNEVLSSSKKYTVWAPSNDALASLSADIINDEQKLKDFIGFYIVELPYNTSLATDTLRLKTLNGKHIRFSKTSFEGAGLVLTDQYTGNGVLHIIDDAVFAKPNVLDIINASAFKQKEYLASLNYQVIDSSMAEQIGVDPLTGKPVYKPGTGLVQKNMLFDRVGNLANEDQEYTVILLADAALESERTKIRPYTQGKSTDSTDLFASVMVMKDLVFKGKFTINNLPAMLVSEDGVQVPINKAAITETYETSNGIVYVMDQMNIPLQNKIRDIRQEGENPVGFSRTDKSQFIAYRQRRNPNTQALFNDIYIFNHKIPLFHAKYKLKDVYSATYKVYWVAPNDVQDKAFKQRFAISDPADTHFAETPVAIENFDEVYVGEYTFENIGDYNAFVVAANNGVDKDNSISLDYFRLEPKLP
ncbi:fasciclin domain-containing protein [Paradesertivirga mongoliensis]|uniref:Fasciclin domain-containing protein n=1 Tax=Paradesertivirga mongoliensis TaxID=2100740 RepID=A0ABW4ZJD5_9SPHI|nr:fasciclin domain-containing protein [Pedobacter mongoliensis]